MWRRRCASVCSRARITNASIEAGTGTRCSSRTGLELEHTRPFGVSPTHDEKLLKAFCRAHNRLAADRFYGDDFMKAKVAAGRSRSG